MTKSRLHAEDWRFAEIRAGIADLDEVRRSATTGLPNGWVPGGNALNTSLLDEDHLVEASHPPSGGSSRLYCVGQRNNAAVQRIRKHAQNHLLAREAQYRLPRQATSARCLYRALSGSRLSSRRSAQEA